MTASQHHPTPRRQIGGVRGRAVIIAALALGLLLLL